MIVASVVFQGGIVGVVGIVAIVGVTASPMTYILPALTAQLL